jgi:hypothetical protein
LAWRFGVCSNSYNVLPVVVKNTIFSPKLDGEAEIRNEDTTLGAKYCIS